MTTQAFTLLDRLLEMVVLETHAADKAEKSGSSRDVLVRCARGEALSECAALVLQFIRDGLDEPQQSGSSESSKQKGGVADTGTTDAAAAAFAGAAFHEWSDPHKATDTRLSVDGWLTPTRIAAIIFNAGFRAGRKQ